jgi:hypothetical protein
VTGVVRAAGRIGGFFPLVMGLVYGALGQLHGRVHAARRDATSIQTPQRTPRASRVGWYYPDRARAPAATGLLSPFDSYPTGDAI